MKLMKELSQLKEAANPTAGLIVVWPGGDGDVYDLVEELLGKFGYRDQGPVEDYVDELEARDVDMEKVNGIEGELAVFYPTSINGKKELLDSLASIVEQGKFLMFNK